MDKEIDMRVANALGWREVDEVLGVLVGRMPVTDFRSNYFSRVPPYSTLIAAAWPVHKKACSLLFSKRRRYFQLLADCIRLRMDIAFTPAWPDALVFLEPIDICNAFIAVMKE